MAAAIVAAPVLLGLTNFLGPYAGDAPSGAALLAKAATVRESFLAAQWFGLLGILAFLPATLGVMRLARRGAPSLSLIGGSLALAGYACGLGLATLDAVTWEMLSFGNRSVMGSLLDRVGNNPEFGVILLSFVVGHVLGSLLLGVALIRARAVPLWAGALFTIGVPVHLVAHISSLQPVDVTSAVIQTAAAVAIAFRVLQTSDDEWDLAPRRREARVPQPELARAGAASR
jgi:hypothetical protein